MKDDLCLVWSKGLVLLSGQIYVYIISSALFNFEPLCLVGYKEYLSCD